jgi:hypothetical protein
MAITRATVEADIEAARTAYAAGDAATARSHLVLAKMAIASLPSVALEGASESWRTDIDKLLDLLDAEERSASQSSVGFRHIARLR